MINFELIRSSASPFLSRVLLVKQKYGSWHFCTTYRAFNVVTIKDRFLFLQLMTCLMSSIELLISLNVTYR